MTGLKLSPAFAKALLILAALSTFFLTGPGQALARGTLPWAI